MLFGVVLCCRLTLFCFGIWVYVVIDAMTDLVCLINSILDTRSLLDFAIN